MEAKIEEYADLQQSMDHFASSVEDALRMQRDSVVKSSNEFKESVKSLRETQQQLEKQLHDDSEGISAATASTEAARRENTEAKGKYEDYLVRKNKLVQMREQLERESRELDGMLRQREQLVADFRERLQQQTRRDNAEVRTYERLLGMTVNASKPGALEFTFTSFAESTAPGTGSGTGPTCSLALDVAGDAFKITAASPPLPATTTQRLEALINDSGSLPQFIVHARDALINRSQ